MREVKDKEKMHLNVVASTIGMMLLIIGMAQYLSNHYNTLNFVMIWGGFLLTLNYIYYLEEQAGIIKTFAWVRAGILIVTFAIAMYIFFK